MKVTTSTKIAERPTVTMTTDPGSDRWRCGCQSRLKEFAPLTVDSPPGKRKSSPREASTQSIHAIMIRGPVAWRPAL
jgi:hypothetical protein